MCECVVIVANVWMFCSHVTAACGSLKLILKNYTPLIRENLTPPNRLGVDITGEERLVCYLSLYLVCTIQQWEPQLFIW